MTPKEITTLAGHRLVPPWVMKLALDVAAAEREKQAEQEPMFFVLTQDHTWLSISEGQYEKVAPEGRMKVYAAPVRTKDLTDEEIEAIMVEQGDLRTTAFARAVIAADRGEEQMTQDEIIRMAREAGMTVFVIESLERFAALVAAHERNRHAWTQEHWTEYEHAIAATEREACAKVCEENRWGNLGAGCAAAIRNRGVK